MVQLKPGFMILRAELYSIKKKRPCIVPWGYDLAPTFYGFEDHDDPLYPKDGISRLPRNHPLLENIIKDDNDWEVFTSFIEKYEEHVEKEDVLYKLSVNNNSNKYKEGANLVGSLLRKMNGAKRITTTIDKLLRKLHGAPYQRAELARRRWPYDPQEESDAGLDSGGVINTVGQIGLPFMRELFGDCFGDVGLEPYANLIAKAFITASWSRQTQRAKNSRKRTEELRAIKLAAEEAVMNSEGKSPMEVKRLVDSWCKALSDFRKIYAWRTNDSEELELQQEQAHIKAFIESAKLGKVTDPTLTGLAKVFECMNDPDIIAQMEDNYAEIFQQFEEPIDEEFREDLGELFDAQGDLGVGEFREKNIGQLRTSLGLSAKGQLDDVFPFFNKWISDLGLLPKDIPGLDDFPWNDDWAAAANEAKLRKFRPEWHQYVGLAAMVKQFISGRNVLLADGVGLGKTLQTLMVCAYMRHVRLMQQKGMVPPIMVDLKADAEERWGWNPKTTCVATEHTLIAVPGMLVKQWEVEALRFLDNRYWNILVYPTVKSLVRHFWERWDKEVGAAAQRNQTTILIVSYNTLRRDSKAVMSSPPAKINLVDQKTGPALDDMVIKRTVFGRHWALVVFDEAQHLRTEGSLSRAAHALRVRSESMILATATPLHNAVQDLVYLGCALGCAKAEKLVSLSVDMEKEIKAAKKNAKGGREQEKQDAAVNIADIASGVELLKARCELFTEIRKKYVMKMRECFADSIIRRTRQSFDYKGNPISDLEERTIVDFPLRMTEDERMAFQKIIEKTRNTIKTGNSISVLPTKLFFNEYRRCIANVRFAGSEKPIPWKDKAEYDAQNSTKWRMVFKIVHYLLSSDKEPFPFFDDKAGKLIFPDKVREDDAKSKIVLYLEFTSLLDSLLQACEFENLNVVTVTGRSATGPRTDAIKKFMMDPNCRIMILSSVGDAGLNLHAAKFMIFMDSVWSGQEEEQIIGRVHRKPNEQKVYVYHPRVAETSDAVLGQFSRSKEQLLNTFLEETISSDTVNAGDEYDEVSSELEGKMVLEKYNGRRDKRKKPEKSREQTINATDVGIPKKRRLDSQGQPECTVR